MNPSPHLISMNEIEFNSASHRVENLSLSPIVGDIHETTAQTPVSKRDTPVAGAIYTQGLSFDYWFAGSGAAGTAPAFGPLLKACGLKETVSGGVSVTYLSTGELNTDLTRVSIDVGYGGTTTALKVPVANAVGDLSIAFRPGEPVRGSFSFDGTYTAPTEASLAAGLATSAHPPAAKGLIITLVSDTLRLKELNVNLNNVTNSPNYDIAGTQGIQNPDLVDQAPAFDVLMVLPAFATQNYWTDFLAETKSDLSAVLGSVAGNIMTLTASGYPLGPPELNETDGILTARMSYRVGWAAADTKLTAVFT